MAKRLKVAMISPAFVRCGIWTYTNDLATAISKLGHKVYLVRLHRWGRPFSEEYFETLALRRIPPDIDICQCQHEYGLYHYGEGWFFPRLREHGVPIVTTMHASGLNLTADDVIAKHSDVVIVHNQHCQRQFRHPSKIIAHGCTPSEPLSVDQARKRLEKRWNLKLKPDEQIITIFGFISEYRGYEPVIRSMRFFPDVRLLVAGGWHLDVTTAYMMGLKRLAEEQAPGQVSWLGWIPDEELPEVFGASMVAIAGHVVSSESGALLRALSFGRCCLASSVPPFREKMRRGVLLCYRDEQDFVAKLSSLLADESVRRNYEEKARNYALRIAWYPNIARAHIRLYRSLL